MNRAMMHLMKAAAAAAGSGAPVGRSPYSLYFDGSASVEVPHNSALHDIPTFTLCAWMKRTGGLTASMTWIGREVATSPTEVPYRFILEASAHRFQTYVGATAREALDTSGGLSGTTDTWLHYAFVSFQDGTTLHMRLYRDGVLIDQDSFADVTRPVRTTGLYFGSDNGSRRFITGHMYDIHKYNRVLSVEEINQVLEGQTLSGLAGHWDFREGSGSTAGDYSGGGNPGTISGATHSTDIPSLS